MTDKTKKAFNNAIASARMEGFDFTDEQIDYLVNTIKNCVAKMRQSSPLWKKIVNEDNGDS